jgi:hypothetical protein
MLKQIPRTEYSWISDSLQGLEPSRRTVQYLFLLTKKRRHLSWAGIKIQIQTPRGAEPGLGIAITQTSNYLIFSTRRRPRRCRRPFLVTALVADGAFRSFLLTPL